MIQIIREPKLSDIIIFSGFICTVMCLSRLTVVQEGFHMIRLYQQLRNEDRGLASAISRYKICKDITRNQFKVKESMKLINKRELQRVLRKPQYSHIFHHVFTRTLVRKRLKRSFHVYKYTNEYKPVQFIAIDHINTIGVPLLKFPVTEHAFVCVIKSFDEIVPLYVSKEYNLLSESNRVGRFLFLPQVFPRTPNQYNILLAEEPATAFEMFDHKVERLYLEIRKYHRPVPSEFKIELDPLCKLVETNIVTNQHDRLCMEIFASAYFENQVKSTAWQSRWECFEREVSFKTKEARREATGRTYKENMISCEGRAKITNKRFAYYVSRAYRSSQVFVYNVNVDQSTGDEKVYLENLFINVNAVEEILGFEDVE